MTKFWLVIFTLMSGVAGAQPKNGYFARYRTLAAAFPKAFAEYTSPEYLVPTYVPQWTGSEAERVLLVKARLTHLGVINGEDAKPTTHLNVTINPDGESNLYISQVYFGQIFPAAYAWRIALAEILLKYPKTLKIDVITISQDAVTDIGLCTERLARGHDRMEIGRATPLSDAMAALGFTLMKFEPERDSSRDRQEAHWIGEVELRSTYVMAPRQMSIGR